MADNLELEESVEIGYAVGFEVFIVEHIFSCVVRSYNRIASCGFNESPFCEIITKRLQAKWSSIFH
ncbi:hypothetical protein D3C80_2051060 [compost metagenome]